MAVNSNIYAAPELARSERSGSRRERRSWRFLLLVIAFPILLIGNAAFLPAPPVAVLRAANADAILAPECSPFGSLIGCVDPSVFAPPGR